jgi:hypothetical protein
MRAFSNKQQMVIGTVLVVLMIVSRGHFLPALSAALPSTSWAVFLVAGIYLRPKWALGGLLALAVLLDAMAIGWGNVSDYCVSVAYAALLPAYGSLWLAGRWFARRATEGMQDVGLLAATALSATAVCEVISSGSFYFYSGRFAEPTLAGFGERLVQYFPHSLAAMAVWVTLAALAHAAFLVNRQSRTALDQPA